MGNDGQRPNQAAESDQGRQIAVIPVNGTRFIQSRLFAVLLATKAVEVAKQHLIATGMPPIYLRLPSLGMKYIGEKCFLIISPELHCMVLQLRTCRTIILPPQLGVKLFPDSEQLIREDGEGVQLDMEGGRLDWRSELLPSTFSFDEFEGSLGLGGTDYVDPYA